VENPPPKSRHVTEHLANERTLLAWIRTAIAVMTLGVAINRFSLFLMEIHKIAPGSRAANVHAETVGLGLVILSIVLLCGALWHYSYVGRTIESETYLPANRILVLTTLAVVAMGGSALIWLF
jgi:putative membrane protein